MALIQRTFNVAASMFELVGLGLSALDSEYLLSERERTQRIRTRMSPDQSVAAWGKPARTFPQTNTNNGLSSENSHQQPAGMVLVPMMVYASVFSWLSLGLDH